MNEMMLLITAKDRAQRSTHRHSSVVGSLIRKCPRGVGDENLPAHFRREIAGKFREQETHARRTAVAFPITSSRCIHAEHNLIGELVEKRAQQIEGRISLLRFPAKRAVVFDIDATLQNVAMIAHNWL